MDNHNTLRDNIW